MVMEHLALPQLPPAASEEILNAAHCTVNPPKQWMAF
jgi:hypothetical protein